jgi:hypothetical protein
MKFRPLDYAVCGVTVLVIAAGSAGRARAQTSATIDSVSTLTGVYTEEQAKRGKDVYLNLCKSCHNPSTGDAFSGRWAGKTLFELFTYIYESMPDNNPRTVDEVSNADIIGYLLQSTGMPVGTRDVPIAADSLKAIRIEVKKNKPPATAPLVGSRARRSTS